MEICHLGILKGILLKYFTHIPYDRIVLIVEPSMKMTRKVTVWRLYERGTFPAKNGIYRVRGQASGRSIISTFSYL